MKYLKKFEGVIKPYDIDHCFDEMREDKNLTVDKINDIFKEYKIKFTDRDEFISNLKTKIEKDGVPTGEMFGGIRFGAVNGYNKTIYICVNPSKFESSINKHDRETEQIYSFLKEVLRHESIHVQQINKTKIDYYDEKQNPSGKIPYSVYNLERSPEKNKKEYFIHRTETMAFAQSFIDQCYSRGLDKEEILNIIKNKRSPNVSWIQNIYKGMDSKVKNQFNKNVYQYLMKDDNNLDNNEYE